MSYTNSTVHYHIPLPTQTDLVNGLDWNDSSEAIDAAVYEASQAAGTAASDIVTIKQDIVDLKAEDVDIKQAATELTGRVSTLEQNATLDEQAIQDIADMITDKEVSQAQSDVEVAEDEWFRYNGVLYVATTAIHIGDTIVPNTNCRATNIEDEMPSGFTPTAADIGYDGTTAGLTADDVQEAIDELKGLIDQIGGGGMPILDYANPLYTFDDTHLTYTAVRECYLCGVLARSYSSGGGVETRLSINNTIIAESAQNGDVSSLDRVYISPLKLNTGDVVLLSGPADSSGTLHVFSVAS